MTCLWPGAAEGVPDPVDIPKFPGKDFDCCGGCWPAFALCIVLTSCSARFTIPWSAAAELDIFYTAAEGASESFDIFKFPEEVLSAAEAAALPLPFAVVGS